MTTLTTMLNSEKERLEEITRILEREEHDFWFFGKIRRRSPKHFYLSLASESTEVKHPVYGWVLIYARLLKCRVCCSHKKTLEIVRSSGDYY